MDASIAVPQRAAANDNLFGRGPAWFAYLMTIGLMVFDYIDRQIIASMFPFLKSDWMLTDAQLGALVSVVSVTVAVFGIPVAWVADRFSRVKSIMAMAATWSIATIACMFSQGYTHLLVAPSSAWAKPATAQSGRRWWRRIFPSACAARYWAGSLRRPPLARCSVPFSAE